MVDQANYSIRRRLLTMATIIVVITLTATGIALDRVYSTTIESNVRERLSATLSLLLASIEETNHHPLTIDSITDGRLNNPEDNLSAGFNAVDYQWLSPSLLGIAPKQLPVTQLGVQTFQLQDDFYPSLQSQYTLIWKLVWELDNGEKIPISLWAAASVDEYNQPVKIFRVGLWRWLSITALLLLALQIMAGFLGMRSLRNVASEVRAVEEGQQQYLESNYPREIQPLTDNLNALLNSERQGQQRYRKALGNLAHSIKTPLAVLQNALDADTVSSQQQQIAKTAIEDLHGVMRYQLERAASAARKTLHEPLAIKPLVEKLVRSLQKVFQEKKPDFDIDISENAFFYGEERDLLELLGNLLENACKYGAGKVKVTINAIDVDKRRPGVSLLISDNGSGLTQQQFQTMLQRGVRGDEKIDGHGLGLSIVAEIIDAYNASIDTGKGIDNGLEVRVKFPGS